MGALMEHLPEDLDGVDEPLESWDGPVQRINAGPQAGKILLPLGRDTQGQWPVLEIAFTQLGWQMIDSACDWPTVKGRKVIFIICLYQLLDKSEIWCLHQTWDAAGYKANNDHAAQLRAAQQAATVRYSEVSLGTFDVMD